MRSSTSSSAGACWPPPEHARPSAPGESTKTIRFRSVLAAAALTSLSGGRAVPTRARARQLHWRIRPSARRARPPARHARGRPLAARQASVARLLLPTGFVLAMLAGAGLGAFRPRPCPRSGRYFRLGAGAGPADRVRRPACRWRRACPGRRLRALPRLCPPTPRWATPPCSAYSLGFALATAARTRRPDARARSSPTAAAGALRCAPGRRGIAGVGVALLGGKPPARPPRRC